MTDLNIDLTIEWDSNDIPIEIDYPESVTISSSTNETISIMLKNENDYVFEVPKQYNDDISYCRRISF